MSKGKPVVGTNVGGIPEIIRDGENGYLFENENSEDLKEKLQKLISDSKLREKMGDKSIEILKSKFDPMIWQKTSSSLSTKYHKANEEWHYSKRHTS